MVQHNSKNKAMSARRSVFVFCPQAFYALSPLFVSGAGLCVEIEACEVVEWAAMKRVKRLLSFRKQPQAEEQRDDTGTEECSF